MAKGISRRDFIKAGTAVTAMAAAGCSAMPWSERPMSVGLQLYAVRDQCANDFPGTIKRVGEMGFAGVEFAGYYGMSAPDLRSKGIRLSPSRTRPSSDPCPASRKVGSQSSTLTGVSHSPAAVIPSQWAKAGTRIPPS